MTERPEEATGKASPGGVATGNASPGGEVLGKASPGGTKGNSPAIHRWGRGGSTPESPRGTTDALEALVHAIRTTAHGRHIAEPLIRTLGSRELAKRRNLKEAIKATKNTLHQVGGAYLGRGIDYPRALAQLRAAARSGPDDLRRACTDLMRLHASTRERLPILEQFYSTTLAGLGPIRSILDVACGLNPLAIPWMPLSPDVEYHACDIYGDLAGFLSEYLSLVSVRGTVEVADVTTTCPTYHVDVAFVLKTLPCLEQIDRSSALRLLDTLDAHHLLVSFPIHSLGGKSKGMLTNYESWFREQIAGKGWTIERFGFPTELVFRLTRKTR